MKIKELKQEFSVCKVTEFTEECFQGEFYFAGKTDEENSLVCLTENAPGTAYAREDGWRAFRIQGTLEFSMVGILAKLSAVLAEENIGIFAISTFNTDYILTKKENFEKAVHALQKKGYEIE